MEIKEIRVSPNIPGWIACCSRNCVDCTRSSPGITTMDARVVVLMVLNLPFAPKFGAEIYSGWYSKRSRLVHATAWLFSLAFKMLGLCGCTGVFELVPLRHAEWRSGTGFQWAFLRRVVSQSSFFAFVCKPSKNTNFVLFLCNHYHLHPTMTGYGASRVHGE